MKKLEKSLIVTLPILVGLTIFTCTYSFRKTVKNDSAAEIIKEESLIQKSEENEKEKKLLEQTEELEIHIDEKENSIEDEGGSENIEPPIQETTKKIEPEIIKKVETVEIPKEQPKQEEIKPTSVAVEQSKEEQQKIETPKIEESKPTQQVVEQPKVEEPKQEEVTPEPTPKVDTFFDSITGGVKEYSTQQACLDAGYKINEMESDEILAYNLEHMDAQIHTDFSYFRCLEVIDSNGSGWFLNIYCNSGDAKYCNNKFKPYLTR